MKTYTYAMVAGVPNLLPFSGRQFYLLDAAYPVDVEFFDASHQNAGEKLEAILSGTWAKPDLGFSSIRLTSALAQTIKFIIATGEAGVMRLTGDVSVIDGGKARTIANQAFCGQVATPAVAAQYSHCQLLNPAGSGMRVSVQQLIISADGPGSAYVGRYDAAGTLANLAPSKNIGGVASVSEIRYANNAAVLLAATGYLVSCRLLANTTALPIVFHEPVILTPGRGLGVVYLNVNVGLSSTFEFLEEPNV